jgi:hypothetical protein
VSDHTTESTPSKRCTKCGESKPATSEYYGKYKRTSDGFKAWCKACVKAFPVEYSEMLRVERDKRRADAQRTNAEKVNARNRQRYHANIEKERQRSRAYHEANTEKVRESGRVYREANREKTRAAVNAWAAANREKNRERGRAYAKANRTKNRARSAAWRKTNADKVKAQDRAYYEANIDKVFINIQRRRARKEELPDTLTTEQWQVCIDYFGGCCAACGRPPGLWHRLSLDHFIPLSSDNCPGTTVFNAIPLCSGEGGCNNSKGNKDALEWATEKFGKRKGKQIVARILAYFSELQGE